MHLSTCTAILLVGLALTRAVPTGNGKKSLDEKRVDIGEAGEDKDRDKKSILCLDVKDNVRTLSLAPQPQALSVQPVARPAQTLSIQPAVQPVQTLSVQPALQPVQTFSIQQAPQPVQTFSIQQAPQPAQALCIQPAVNIVQAQPVSQTSNAQTETVPKPAPSNKEDYARPTGQPSKMIKMEREEVVDIVPVYQDSGCNEQLVAPMPRPVLMMPQPEVVAAYIKPYKPPCCQHCQQPAMRCKCRPRAFAAAMRSANMMMDQPMPYMGFRDDHVMDPMHGRLY